MEKSLNFKSLLFIFFCGLCWGPSYLFIKLAVFEIPPLTLVFFRVLVGAVILFLICRFQKLNFSLLKQNWKQCALLGITLNALPFLLITFGELYISSSLTGILNSLTLIFTAIFAHFFGSHDALTKNKILGIFVGLVGLCVIYLPLLQHEGASPNFGVLMIVGACISYGIGTVYAKTHLKKVPGLIALTSQLAIAALILLPFSFFIDQPYLLPLPSWQALVGILGLGIIGTSAGFYFYYKAIQLAGATYASFSVLLTPILAMALGAIILNEQLTWNLYVGAFFIISGVLAVNPIFNKKSKN